MFLLRILKASISYSLALVNAGITFWVPQKKISRQFESLLPS